MKIKYYPDTDTLYIEFRDRDISETRDLDENTLLASTRKATSAHSPSNTQARARTSAV